MKRVIFFYKKVDGYCPMEDFLDSLPPKMAQKVTWVLKLVEELDRIPSTYYKKLIGTDEIWECRIRLGLSICRVFCFLEGVKVILTHGFIKKSQKTPKVEIKKAETYRKDYLERRKV